MAFYKIISWFFTVIIFKLNKKEAGSGAAAPAKFLCFWPKIGLSQY